MRFQPKTEAELEAENAARKAAYQPWPKGMYDFVVNTGEDTYSKKGNEMIKLSLNIYNADGQVRQIDDYLLEAMEYKLRHAAEACGLLERYENGELNGFDFVGKSGKLYLDIQKGKQKDDGSFYSDRNSVQDYLVQKQSVSKEHAANELDDSVPF